MEAELLERLNRVRLELGALERFVRSVGDKSQLRIVADCFERLNELEAECRTGIAQIKDERG